MAKHLYWSGCSELGGILVVAESAKDAAEIGHGRICGCGCSVDECEGWRTTDVEEDMQAHPSHRLRLVNRDDKEPPTPVIADGPRLWWLFNETQGFFVVGTSEDDVREYVYHSDPDIVLDDVQQIRRVDGYDVLVEVADND